MSLYSSTYRHLLWPGYEKMRGRGTHRLLGQADQRQWWSPNQIVQYQEKALATLLAHARRQCPYYRQLLQAHPTVNGGSVQEQLAHLPLLTRAQIRDQGADMIAADYRDRVYEHRTGGSTGVPLTFYLTRETYEWRNAMTLRGYGWAGAHEGVKAFYLWSVAVGTISRSTRWKTQLHDWFLRRQFFNNFQLSKTSLPDCLAQLNRYKPVVLVGYTSMLEYLARHIKRHGGLRVRLRSVITAAEAVNPAQRELLREVFNAPVFASYGSREFKLIAMECERGGLHLSADNLYVEYLRQNQAANPGDLARLVITDLHNFGMPFIRYEIGDVATPGPSHCPCGRGLPLLGQVHGRMPDTIQSPDGKLISGIFFPHLLKEFDWIEQFQVVQKELDRVELKLVITDATMAERQMSSLRQQVLAVLGPSMRLEIDIVPEIARNATGKHRAVISEIPVEI